MAVDTMDDCGIYFGTTGGQVYASADGGDNWAPIVRDLPAVLRHLSAPRGAIRDEPPPWFQQRAGSLITLNQMIAGAAVQSWLDLLAGDLTTSFWQRLSWNHGKCGRRPGKLFY